MLGFRRQVCISQVLNSTAVSQTQWTFPLLTSVIKIKVTHSQLWLLKLKPEDKIWYFAKREEPATLTVCFQGLLFSPLLSVWALGQQGHRGEGNSVFELQEEARHTANLRFHGTRLSRAAADQRHTQVSPALDASQFTLCMTVMSLIISRGERWSQWMVTNSHVESSEK